MCCWKNNWTIADYLTADYQKWKQREYLFLPEPEGSWKAIRFGAVIEDVWRVSRYLLQNGYGGKRIALYGENCPAWAALYLSIMGYVGCCFPIDKEYGEGELCHILLEARPALFLYGEEKAQLIESIKTRFPNTQFLSMNACFALAAGESAADGFERRDMDEVVNVLFTSGTAAQPKAVMLTQRNLFHNWGALFRRTPMTERDAIYLALPLSHVYAGVAAFLYTIISGMAVYFGTPNGCAHDLRHVKPTVFISVPILLERLCAAAEKEGIPLKEFFGGRMKHLYCGGTPVPQKMKEAFFSVGIPILEAYGLSETASVVALDRAGDYCEGSTGYPLESLVVRILNPDKNGVGEVLIQGGSVMKGYFHNEKLTRETLDAAGFFHTGDLGRLDNTGRLYLMGRKKRMLLTGNGKNVYPDEIETCFQENPVIKRAKLWQKGDKLYLTAWYEGERQEAESWLLEVNQRLPKYQRFHVLDLIEDKLGGRLK